MNRNELIYHIAYNIVDTLASEYDLDADDGWDESVASLEMALDHFSDFDLECVSSKLDIALKQDAEDDTDVNMYWDVCNHMYLYLTYCYQHDASPVKWLNDWCY